MLISTDTLIASAIAHKSLLQAIDRQALGLEPLQPKEPLQASRMVEIPSHVIRELWESSSNKRVQLGVLALLLRLDKPCTILGITSFNMYQYLERNGIDIRVLQDSLSHAISLGLRTRLHSHPQYGRFYKRPRRIV